MDRPKLASQNSHRFLLLCLWLTRANLRMATTLPVPIPCLPPSLGAPCSPPPSIAPASPHPLRTYLVLSLRGDGHKGAADWAGKRLEVEHVRVLQRYLQPCANQNTSIMCVRRTLCGSPDSIHAAFHHLPAPPLPRSLPRHRLTFTCKNMRAAK